MTVNVEVVVEPTALAEPEKVPSELKVKPPGIEPDVTAKVILSPSASVAATVVKLLPALSASCRIPKEPEATVNVGALSTFIWSLKVEPKLELLFITFTSYGSFAFANSLLAITAVIEVELFTVSHNITISS